MVEHRKNTLMKLRIVNTTGRADDTKVYAGETEITGIISIEIERIVSGRILTATIECYPEIDTVVNND